MPSRQHSSCDHQALAALTLGQLQEPQRSALEQHLSGCEPCSHQLRWLERVGGLLGAYPGQAEEEHPPSADLQAHAAGELEGDRRHEVQAHVSACLPCRRLEWAARAGLEELRRLESSEESASRPAPSPTVFHVLTLPQQAPLRAAAHDPGQGSPAPEDRRVLDELPGVFCLVYYRRRARGMLGLFHEPDMPAEVSHCSLDHEALEPETSPGAQVFGLGPASELWGRTIQIRFQVGGQARDLSWTVVREG